jgi:hypothetical protein
MINQKAGQIMSKDTERWVVNYLCIKTKYESSFSFGRKVIDGVGTTSLWREEPSFERAKQDLEKFLECEKYGWQLAICGIFPERTK